ncbi:MAG: GNAT family N-acetyltransferase [Nanoarchaeota archaeon]|nr:GNAT family N-acetyltransferase [Nanoarchaeota archaeon]
MELRKAKVEDKEELIRVIQLADERSGEVARKKVDKFIESDKGFFILACDGEKIVGYLLFGIYDEEEGVEKFIDLENYASVLWIAILPEYRKTGLGSRLLDEAEKYAEEFGKKGVWLGCREGVLEFYGKNGYENVGNFLRKTSSGRMKPYYVMVKEVGMVKIKYLKSVIESLNPKLFGVDEVKIGFFKKLGVGEGNVNYVFKIGDKKYICRMNIDKGMPGKSRTEFKSLKAVEGLGIAPKVYYCHPRSKIFPLGFIILEYIEGKAFYCRKRSYTTGQIKQIARVLGELHSVKVRGFSKEDYSYEHYLKQGRDYNRIINKRSDKLKRELGEINKKVEEFLSGEERHKFSLIHGDVCPQNIVEARDGLKLIDWESLQYSDPAKDVANILIDVELKGKDLALFLKEYGKVRNDSGIFERAKIYAVLFRYNYFLWEITRSFEIANKELPEEYLNKTSALSHIHEAKFQYKHLRELIDVPKINIDSLFEGVL